MRKPRNARYIFKVYYSYMSSSRGLISESRVINSTKTLQHSEGNIYKFLRDRTGANHVHIENIIPIGVRCAKARS